VTVAVVSAVTDVALGAGAAAKSVALAKAMAAAGARVLLITTDIGLDRRQPDVPGVETVVIRSPLARFPVPLIGRRAMAARLATCDAIILVNHWTILNAIAYLGARRAGVPWILCPAGALRIQGRSRALKRLYQAVAGRRMIADAAAIVATTEVEAAQFREDGVPERRIRVIPNAVDPEPVGMSAADFRSTRGIPPGPLLLYMGRLNLIKGPDLLLEAFVRIAERFPDWNLVMAGRDEGLERSLQLRAERAGLSSRVHLTGTLAPVEAIGAYRAASLLVVPSRHEAMSLVALEAAVAATPVLLTDACGFAEVAAVGGGAVAAATVDSLADALSALLADRERLPAMGERLRRLAVAQYGWPRIVGRYLELVGELQRGQPA
jgi:glycosyltransferase involved in cell wall biosynthesis